MIKIAFFGDSIFYGQYISTNRIWVAKLSQVILDKFVGQEIWINNPSHPGDTTRIALEKMPVEIQKDGVDIIHIQFGMNDCNYWQTDKGLPRVSKESFRQNIIEIITRAEIFGAKFVFLHTNHPSTRTNKFDYAECSYQESNSDYNQIIREVASVKKVTLVDIEESIRKDGREHSDYLLPDQIHLSDLGHKIYFKTILPFTERALENFLKK
jgi:acyl-CoA thioesterase-1